MNAELDHWRAAERSDLILLRKQLKAGTVTPEKRAAIFAALEERAKEKGGRFAHSLEQLKLQFGVTP